MAAAEKYGKQSPAAMKEYRDYYFLKAKKENYPARSVYKLKEMDKAYRALGRIMYQIENGNLNRDDSIVEAACNQVRIQEELIAKLQKDKEDVKKSADENVVDVEATEVPEEEKEEAEQPQPEKDPSGYFVLKFCPYCKVGNHPDATKCVSCGKEI